MELSVFFAGTAGSVPTPRRGLPAIVLQAGGHRILFDCGEGTQQQLMRSIGLPDFDAIFITHLHLDHWLGLLGMLKTFDLRDRDRPLTLYGPTGLKALMKAMTPAYGRVSYPLTIEELDPHDDVDFDGYTISAFPVEHRVPAFGFAFTETDRPGHFDPEEAERRGLKPGPEFGRVQHGETIRGVSPSDVMGPTRPGRRIVFSGDTAPCQATEVFAHKADLLIHESTFLAIDAERARETGHSTARAVSELARDAEIKMLALNHLSTRYFPTDVCDEARAAFPNTVIPRDFDTIELPFPERGAPQLVSWRDRKNEQDS